MLAAEAAGWTTGRGERGDGGNLAKTQCLSAQEVKEKGLKISNGFANCLDPVGKDTRPTTRTVG
jgi:hypothetical protein